MYMIKDIPVLERPRERLLKYGSGSLSNEELLAIILKNGTKKKSAKVLALEVLNLFPDIRNLKEATLPKLKEIKGIGEVKAIEVMATIELGRRIFLDQERSLVKLTNAEDIWHKTKALFDDKKQEYFYALYFNNKQELLGKKLLFLGTVNQTVVHPREIFKEAYLLSASSIICIHNHPSGNTNPSREDIHFTNSLMEIGNLQGIPIIDHIIVGKNSFYSFYENKQQE